MARADRRRRDEVVGRPALNQEDTIVALSSGSPPAAIAVLRMSGPAAMAAAASVAGSLPPPRRAALRTLRDGEGRVLDHALVIVFPGPATVTGEDIVECHCHGGRAVVAAVEAALLARPGLRRAQAGEFTRRALASGRIDLAEAQGLADLLGAETEAERRWAIEAADGAISRLVRGWMQRLTALAAQVEAAIDYGDEGDVVAGATGVAGIVRDRDALAHEIAAVVAAPPVERWRDGWRIAIAGPPNAGKSTLINMLAQRDAAIVSPIAGTTRDRIEVAVQRAGVGYVLLDTAGLRAAPDDEIERIGIARAEQAIAAADVLLWVEDRPPAVEHPETIWVQAKADLSGEAVGADIATRHDEIASVQPLWQMIAERVASRAGSHLVALHERQRDLCRAALASLSSPIQDEVLLAESLRQARRALGAILGIDATEALLDEIFARFCVGK